MASFTFDLLVSAISVRKDPYGPPGPGQNVFNMNMQNRRSLSLGYNSGQATNSWTAGGSLSNGQTLVIDLLSMPAPISGFSFSSISHIQVSCESLQSTSYLTIGSLSANQFKVYNAVLGTLVDFQRTVWAQSVELHYNPVVQDAVSASSRYITLTGHCATSSSSSGGGPIEETLTQYLIGLTGTIAGEASS